MYTQIPLATLFAVLATASPIRDFHPKPYLSARSDTRTVRAAAEITSDQILAIAPNSSTCDNPPAEGECATAEQAAPYISDSFTSYGVDNVAEQAALISLMAFETGDFKYNRNHFPGVAGQGSMSPFTLRSFLPSYLLPDHGVYLGRQYRADFLNEKRETCNPQPSTTNTPPRSPN